MPIIIIVSIFRIFLVAYSIRLIYSVSKILDLSHAIIITFGAYFTHLFLSKFGLSLFLSISISILLSILLGLSIFWFIYKPLLNKKVPNWQMLIASLGIYIILQNIISIFFGDDAKSIRTWEVKEGYLFLNSYISDVQLTTIIISIITITISWLLIEKTNIGKQIKAVSSNPNLSQIFGISTNKAISYSFMLSSAIASIAGILIASDSNMTPTMGFNWLLYSIVAMIISGMGKIHFLFMGSVLLAIAQYLSAYYIDSKWMNATAFLILIVFLYFNPYGFSGKKLKKAEL